MFKDGEALRCGAASVCYLCSRRAAQEIHAYRPDALIIAMVRKPVEMLASPHSQLVFNDVEDLTDCSAALAAEPDRRAGRRIRPNNGPHPWRLFYREVAPFHEQLQRFHRARPAMLRNVPSVLSKLAQHGRWAAAASRRARSCRIRRRRGGARALD